MSSYSFRSLLGECFPRHNCRYLALFSLPWKLWPFACYPGDAARFQRQRTQGWVQALATLHLPRQQLPGAVELRFVDLVVAALQLLVAPSLLLAVARALQQTSRPFAIWQKP